MNLQTILMTSFSPKGKVGGDYKEEKRKPWGRVGRHLDPYHSVSDMDTEAAVGVWDQPAHCREVCVSSHLVSAGEMCGMYCRVNGCKEAGTDNRHSRLNSRWISSPFYTHHALL